MIQLKAEGKWIDTAQIKHLFTQGEKYSDRIHILVDAVNNEVDVSDCTFVMRTVASDGSMTETLLQKTTEEERISLLWDIPQTVTAVAGMLHLEIIGSREAANIIKYKMPPIFVKEAVMGGDLPVPDVLDEKLALMNEILEEVTEIADGINADGTIQEVIDARTGCFSDYTYESLQQRLNAELGVCVRQNALEQVVSDLTVKNKQSYDCAMGAHAIIEVQLRPAIEALETEVNAARTAADGTTRETLEARLTYDFADVQEQISWITGELATACTDFDGQKWSNLAGRLGADLGSIWTVLGKEQEQIDTIQSSVGLRKKNLLKNTAASATKSGVTFTVNDDGTVTCSGTATADTELIVRNMTLAASTNYILTGCPEGGTGSSYRFYAMNTTTWAIAGADYGSGLTFSTGSNTGWTFRIQIKSGCVTDGLTFRPMLRHASVTDDTYEAYTDDLQTQINAIKAAIEALGGTVSATTETEETV